MWYEYYKMGERFMSEFLFFLSRNSNQIYQVGFKDRNKLIHFSIWRIFKINNNKINLFFYFPILVLIYKKPSVTKITTIERKQLFSIIKYFQYKLP